MKIIVLLIMSKLIYYFRKNIDDTYIIDRGETNNFLLISKENILKELFSNNPLINTFNLNNINGGIYLNENNNLEINSTNENKINKVINIDEINEDILNSKNNRKIQNDTINFSRLESIKNNRFEPGIINNINIK